MRPIRALSQMLVGLIATATLLGVLIGVPAVLFAMYGAPSLPPMDQVHAALTQQDQGQLFQAVLAPIFWVAWAWFAVTFTLSTYASIRGVHLPSFAAPRWQSNWLTAAFLLVTVPATMLASTTSTALADNSRPAIAVTQTYQQPAGAVQTSSGSSSQQALEVQRWSGPTHVVGANEQLWDISAHYLGAGQRYQEIADLNYRVLQPGGHTLNAADGHQVKPGWTLRLPAHATTTRPAGGTHDVNEVVKPGDTLSGIAAAELGDANLWPRIYDASKDTVQPGGHRITNPNLIHPGDVVTIPEAGAAPRTAAPLPPAATHPAKPADTGRHAGSTSTATTGHTQAGGAATGTAHPKDTHGAATAPHPGGASSKPGKHAAAAQSHPGTPHGAAAVPPQTAPPVTGAETTAPAAPARTPGAPSHIRSTGAAAARSTSDHDDNGSIPAPVRTAGGIGALLAAAILLRLGRNRARQQKERRAGQEIPMTTDPDVVVHELELGYVERPNELERLNIALRTLAGMLDEAGSPLPQLRVARVTTDRIELRLATPATLPEPFLGVSDETLWILDADATLPVPYRNHDDQSVTWVAGEELDALTDEQLAQLDSVASPVDVASIPAPYPSLVTIGHDLEDAHLLLDLERIGALAVDGAAEQALAILTAIAVELALSGRADDLQITMVGCCPELPDAVPAGRARHIPGLEELLTSLETRAGIVREILTDVGAGELHEARSRNVAPDVWAPEIILLADPVPAHLRDRLDQVLFDLPRVGIAAVTAHDEQLSQWALRMTSPTHATLEPAGITLAPQMVNTTEYAMVIGELTTSTLPPVDVEQHPPVPAEPTLAELTAPAAMVADTDGQVIHLDDIDLKDTDRGGDDDAGAQNAPDEDLLEPAPSGPELEGTGRNPLAEAMLDFQRLTARPATTNDQAAAPEAEIVVDLEQPIDLPDNPSEAVPGDDTRQLELSTNDDDLHQIDPTHPFIRVLGKPVLENAQGPLERGRRNTLTSMAVLMRLTSSVNHRVFEQRLSDDSKLNVDTTRWSNMSRLRKWLGTTPDGEDYVPQIRDGAPYALHELVGLDWDEFRRLVPPRTETSVDNAHLVAALKLVRDQPFAGVLYQTAENTKYAYADRYMQPMITAIANAAHELARRALVNHDAATARWAVAKGLLASPENDQLIRDAIKAEWVANNRPALRKLVGGVVAQNEQLGIDIDPETDELIRQLHLAHAI